MYNYTERLEITFQNKTKRINGFYSREDFERALRRLSTADTSSYRFRKHDLEVLCEQRDIDCEALIADPNKLLEIPDRAGMMDEMLGILYDMYRLAPTAADYMERIVRRLAPEYDGDSVRLAILKKFMAEVGENCRTLPMKAVFEYAKNHPMDEAVFDEERMEAELDVDEMLGLVRRRLGKMSPEMVAQLELSEEEAQFLGLSGETAGGVPGSEQAGSGVGSMSPEMVAFAMTVIEKFKTRVKNVFYTKANGKQDRVSELFRLDVRDARDKKRSDWQMLRLCDDLAKGIFRTNGGKTKVYLYYFAFVFDMTVAIHDDDKVDNDRDMVKNLLMDYYGETGLNFKNFTEAVYMYYLYNYAGQPAGELIDRAEGMIDRCVRLAGSKKYKDDIVTEAITERTEVFKDMYEEQFLELTEDELEEYILYNYQVLPEKGQKTTRIMIASEENTAYEMIDEMLDELDELYQYQDDGEDGETPEFEWKLAERIQEWKDEGFSGDDYEGYIKAVKRLQESLTEEYTRVNAAKARVMMELLGVLRRETGEGRTASRYILKKCMAKRGCPVTETMLTQSLHNLQEMGFDLRQTDGSWSLKWNSVTEVESHFGEKWNGVTVVSAHFVEKMRELYEECVPANRHISRELFVAVYVNGYILREETEDIESFPELYEDFVYDLNEKLELARFKSFSEKNFEDMFVLLSVYNYLLEDRGLNGYSL